MATRTVTEMDGEGKRCELASLGEDLKTALAAYAQALVSWQRTHAEGGTVDLDAHPARVDVRFRREVLGLAREALTAAMSPDVGDWSSWRCRGCDAATVGHGVEKAPVDTVLGRVEPDMARRRCRRCGKSARPREALLGIKGSMTPGARRMASAVGSTCCHAEADRLLHELAGVNLGAKRVERTTSLVGDDIEAQRLEALGEAAAAAGDAPEAAEAERKSVKKGEGLCVALDGTGVPALPSETTGRTGRDGGRATTREAKVGALWIAEPDGGGGLRTAPDSVRYFAAVESAADGPDGRSKVASRLLRELAAPGFRPGDVGTALGDGAD